MTTTDRTTNALDPRLAHYTGHLARLVAVRSAACRRAALPAGRTVRELGVLTVLADGPRSQAQLGTLLRVNRTIMISVIDDMESDALVRRQRDPADRRRYALQITEQGRATLPELYASTARADRALTRPLRVAQRRRLVELLRRIVPELVEPLPSMLSSLPILLIDHASQQLRNRSENSMSDHGVTPRCVRMLVALDAAQPCTQERLANAMSLAPPSIVAALDELRANGLMLTESNPDDRREHVLRLSENGDRYLAEALRAEHTAQQQLADELGAPDTEELNSLLTALLR